MPSIPRRSQPPSFIGLAEGFDPIADARLGNCGGQVVAHGAFGQEQASRDISHGGAVA